MRAGSNKIDWVQISAYLDGRLTPDQNAKFETLIDSDPELKQAVREFRYTKRMLASLPSKKAPRNFTLSPEKVKSSVRRTAWFQPVLGFVSVGAAIMLVVVFAGSTLLPLFGSARSAAPMAALAPENAIDNQKLAAESTSPPMIIQWAPNLATGLGGGGIGGGPGGSGGGGDGSAGTTGLIGGGDGSTPVGIGGGYGGGPSTTISTPTPAVPTDQAGTQMATPAPTATQAVPTPTLVPTATREPTPAVTADPSLLILGLPAPGTGGESLDRQGNLISVEHKTIPVTTIVMIVLGGIALLSGAFAVIFRKR
jgi:hypothetical protein